jgi:hypothetical protein
MKEAMTIDISSTIISDLVPFMALDVEYCGNNLSKTGKRQQARLQSSIIVTHFIMSFPLISSIVFQFL